MSMGFNVAQSSSYNAIMTRRARFVSIGVLIIPVCVFTGAFCVGIGGRIEMKETRADPPLAKMRVTVHDGQTHEIFATLASGFSLEKAVDLRIFDGFDPRMTLDAARSRVGPPTGEWNDLFCGQAIPFYERPQGRVSLCRYQTSGEDAWATVGYPRQCHQDHLFHDQRIPQQVVPWLTATDRVAVHILRPVGWGGVTVMMSRTSCSWVVLSERQ